VAGLQERHDWPGLKGIVMVGDALLHYLYITSLVLLASQLGPIIQSHWAIENNLHWTLD
jgi:predicted transposase YbfD/YdcC